MKKLLIVVDIQDDFIYGSLGTPEAQAIVPNVVNKLHDWDGDIIFTRDTHHEDCFETNEGRHLPIKHCRFGASGWLFCADVVKAMISSKKDYVVVDKTTFGSTELPEEIRYEGYEYIELIGLCTDMCVVSNALILKAYYPETDIVVDVSCCAGSTPDNHDAAIKVMRACQIDIIGE